MAVAPPKAEAVAQATVSPPKGPGDEAKEQGNTHFKAKEYLKAAASLHAESAVATVAQRVTLVAWGRGFGI